MPDAPAANNAEQADRREGNGLWGMLQVREHPLGALLANQHRLA